MAKAIRDGGIDAVIDHANKWMLSKEVADIYATAEPAVAFHERVSFCLDMHNEVIPLSLQAYAHVQNAVPSRNNHFVIHQAPDQAAVGVCVQTVRAMRFDIGANRKKVPDAETMRDRVIAEEELAKAMEEEDDGL